MLLFIELLLNFCREHLFDNVFLNSNINIVLEYSLTEYRKCKVYRFPTLPVAVCCPVIKTAQLVSSKSVVRLDQRTLRIGQGGNMKVTDRCGLLIYDYD